MKPAKHLSGDEQTEWRDAGPACPVRRAEASDLARARAKILSVEQREAGSRRAQRLRAS